MLTHARCVAAAKTTSSRTLTRRRHALDAVSGRDVPFSDTNHPARQTHQCAARVDAGVRLGERRRRWTVEKSYADGVSRTSGGVCLNPELTEGAGLGVARHAGRQYLLTDEMDYPNERDFPVPRQRRKPRVGIEVP